MVTIAAIACYAHSCLVCKALPGHPGPLPQWCRAAGSHGAEAVTPVVTSEAVSCTGVWLVMGLSSNRISDGLFSKLFYAEKPDKDQR